MRIELTDIITCEGKEMSKQAEVELTSFDSKLGRFPIVKKAPFVLKFTNESNKRLLIQGETEVTIAIPCDRCLETVERIFPIIVDKELDLTGNDEEKALWRKFKSDRVSVSENRA